VKLAEPGIEAFNQLDLDVFFAELATPDEKVTGAPPGTSSTLLDVRRRRGPEM
jgi:hypothetical protein